ncbi:MATE family multidrug resistance protein [Edaphobacter aggregans]|uniref:Multidrug-efflux transporter n=1 Tax=Edaphobacter aggregans TaxID=570835 RepID=A0A428MGU3_9BACT|nr:MATE family efflux transporter [Edaphobacter aggregans]RSL16225.1 MATE family multidrug resistance protein [Edaphobacter aggregans]
MSIRQQIRPVLTLALPLILAELGWMSMGIVDTMMVGHMANPSLAISAAALGQVLYNTLGFGIAGVLLSLDTYLSQSHGAGRYDEANRWLLHGLVLAAVLAAIFMGLIALAPIFMLRLPIDHQVITGAIAFLRALNWGTPVLFLYFTLRRYLQAFNHVRPIAAALITANLCNVIGNWLLIYGHSWGPIHIPALGVTGSGLSTSISRAYLALFVAATVWRVERQHNYGLRSMLRHIESTRLTRLALLGAPAGAQIFVEIAIFATVTFLIGTMGPLPLSGHEIALNCASFTFMVPFAISAAAAVRVGQAIGRKAPQEAAAAGWAAILFGAACMATFSAILFLFPHPIARAFTPDPNVIAATIPLLFVAALFQFFDGLQITATGALRGAGNTHAGLIVQIVGYWIIGLPIGYLLAFRLHHGAVGLWLGLCAGLIVAGLSLTTVWHRTTKKLRATSQLEQMANPEKVSS